MEEQSKLIPIKEVLIWLTEKANAAGIKTLQKISYATINAWVKKGSFPEPIVLSPKKIFWNVKDLQQWWNDKIGN